MCEAARTTPANNYYKMAYQFAYYYKDLDKGCPDSNLATEPRRRPDLYVYDPIVDEKISTYKKCYDKKKLKENSEYFGKLYLSSKYTLKTLYGEFQTKSLKPLRYDLTTTDSDYIDPTGANVETELLNKFYSEALTDKIKKSLNEYKSFKFYYPYISTSHSVHRCFHQIAFDDTKEDYITDECKIKEQVLPAKKKLYKVIPRVFSKLPFTGVGSTYRTDFTDPALKPLMILEVKCLDPESVSATVEAA